MQALKAWQLPDRLPPAHGDYDLRKQGEEELARRSKTRSRVGGLRDMASRLVMAGIMMLLIPVIFSKMLGNAAGALGQLTWLGLALLLGGGLLFWLSRARMPSAGPASSFQRPQAPSPPARRVDRPAPVPVTVPDVVEALPAKLPTTQPAPPARPTAWGPAVFDVIEWRRFEAVVEALFAQAGFETKAQSHGADGGVDVWLYSRNQPGPAVSVVQCKHWQGKKVGVDKIRELRGVMAAHNVRRGQFATTSTFTEDALAFGRENSINLLDVSGLLGLIAQRTPEQQQALLAVALEGEYWRPTCVNCGTKLTERTPRGGGKAFWGCLNYPRCKTTMPMRSA